MFRLFIASFIMLLIILLTSGCADNADKTLSQEERVKRGEYLVTFGGCNDCHSPKIFSPEGMEHDNARLLSGHPQDLQLGRIDTSLVQPGKWYMANSHLTAWVGPWGISYSANLTPDGPTGIGSWTDEIFIKSMRTGQHMGAGRPILPPMPWMYINKLTDEDLKAVFSYLKSLPPIRNQVPDPVAPPQLTSFNQAMTK